MSTFSAADRWPSGRRRSPAKGVGGLNRLEGSNPFLSATISLMHNRFAISSAGAGWPPETQSRLYLYSSKFRPAFPPLYMSRGAKRLRCADCSAHACPCELFEFEDLPYTPPPFRSRAKDFRRGSLGALYIHIYVSPHPMALCGVSLGTVRRACEGGRLYIKPSKVR